MSTDTDNTEIVKPENITIVDNNGRVLTNEEVAVMDRGVRAGREAGYCGEFDRIAAIAFNTPVISITDSNGRSCAGYDREGFNEDGYDRKGLDKDGYDYSGRNENGYDKAGFDRYGFNVDGLDKNGHDKYCFDISGYDREGYNSRYGERRAATREWYEAQAIKPDSAFYYDRRGNQRPVKAATA